MFACCLLLTGIALPLQAWAVDTDGDGYDDAVDVFPSDPAAAVSTINSTVSTVTNTMTLDITVTNPTKLQYDYKFAKQNALGGTNTFTIPCDTCQYSEASVTDTWLTETRTLTPGTYQL